MTDEPTPLFKKPKPSPVAIHWGPNYDQMEKRGVNAQFINAFRIQTMQLESAKDDLDLVRHAYADLADKAQIMDQELALHMAEIDRLSRQRAADQMLIQKQELTIERLRKQVADLLDGK
jgi:hypothetical protein